MVLGRPGRFGVSATIHDREAWKAVVFISVTHRRTALIHLCNLRMPFIAALCSELWRKHGASGNPGIMDRINPAQRFSPVEADVDACMTMTHRKKNAAQRRWMTYVGASTG